MKVTARRALLTRGVLSGLAAAALAAPAWAGYSSTSLIDVPTSEYLDNLQYEGDFIAAVSGDNQVSNYGVFNANLGVGGMAEVGLAVYSLWDAVALAGHFKVEAIDEEHFGRYQPSLSLGMDNLTIGDGIISHGGDRFPGDTAAYDVDFRDNISPFVIASKTIEPLGTFHLGWGGGRFRGQGPYSRYFHGVIMGYNRRVWRTLEIMVEEDGRDVNIGVRHSFPWITVGAAVEKAEQLGRSFDTFYSITVEVSPRPLHQGPERLATRRRINNVRREISVLRGKAASEQEKVKALKQKLDDLVAESHAEGIDTRELEDLQGEIDRLQQEIDKAGSKGRSGKESPNVKPGI